MSKLQKTAAAVLIALLAAAAYGLWATNPAPVTPVKKANAASWNPTMMVMHATMSVPTLNST